MHNEMSGEIVHRLCRRSWRRCNGASRMQSTSRAFSRWREISQYIVDISTVQHQMNFGNQVQVVERIQEQNMDPIKVVPEE